MANNSININKMQYLLLNSFQNWNIARHAVAFTVSKILRDQKRPTPKFWDFDGFFFFIRFLPASVSKSWSRSYCFWHKKETRGTNTQNDNCFVLSLICVGFSLNSFEKFLFGLVGLFQLFPGGQYYWWRKPRVPGSIWSMTTTLL